MVKQSNSERRKSVRAKRVLSVQYRLVKSKIKTFDDSWNLSMTQDMSVGGLLFYTDQEYRVDDMLELHVVMSGVLDIYKGFGKVVRVEKKKTGAYMKVAVKFVDKKLRSRKVKAYTPKKRVRGRSIKRI